MSTEDLFFEVKQAFLAEDKQQNFPLLDEENALQLFFNLFALKNLDEPTIDKIINVLRYEDEVEKNILAQRLAAFLVYFLEKDFFVGSNEEKYLRVSPEKLSQNTFLAYWTILSYANTNGLNVLPSYTQANFLDKFCLFVKKSKPYRLNLSHQNLRQANLMKVSLKDANLSKCDLAGASLMFSGFKNCNFHNASLELANLTVTNLEGSKLSSTNLREATLLKTQLKNTQIHACDFHNAELGEANFAGSQIFQSSFQNVEANYINLQKTNIEECDFSNTKLYKANFSNARLFRSKITEADLYGSIWEYVDVLNIEFDAKTFESAVFRYTFLDEVNAESLRKSGGILEE